MPDFKSLPSPGPWQVYDRGIGWEVHNSAGQRINDGFRDTFTETDARLIVQAVNSHEDLLSAVKQVRAMFVPVSRREETQKVIDMLDAAIAKAEAPHA